MLGRVELQLHHHAAEPRRLAVVAPPHRLSVDVREQGGDTAVADHRLHVGAVVHAGARRPLVVGVVAMCLHAVTRLPRGEIARRAVVEEVQVVGDALWRDVEHEIPVVSALLGDLLPHGLRRGAHVKLALHLRHDASRPTVCTSRTPSIFSIRRESWASESISTVADTTAVLSSCTFTSSDDMLTWVSAMTVAMSRIRP